MSIASLLDHTARIWRRTETLDDYRASVPGYTVAHASLACASDGQNSVLANPGPGMVESGRRWIYFDIGADLQHRDVIELLTGPTAPASLEIESVDEFRGHHIEVQASEFTGELPSVGS